MCGRFAMDSKTNDMLEQIVAEHGMSAIKDWQKYWPPNYNVAPTQQVPVAAEHDGVRSIESVRWGMVAPGSKVLGGRPVINARIETVASNGMFKYAFRDHRVVVPALGYYEWKLADDGKKDPYFVHLPDRPLALAGIVRSWYDPTLPKDDPEAAHPTMAIVTMDAHVVRGEVHDREPAMLLPDAVDDWLGADMGTEGLVKLLERSSEAVAEELDFYRVTRAVNASVVKGQPNNSPEFIEPV